MTFVGLLEADLQDASEYKTGGIGPLFRETRAEELLSLSEFLSHIIRGLRKAGVKSAVTLFVDDVEVYTDPEAGEEDNLDAVLAAANNAEEGTSFYLMLVHEDDELSHVITAEGAVDHPADEAALTVLDLARFRDEGVAEDEEDEDEEEDEGQAGEEAGEPADDGLPDISLDERDGEALVEAFLQKLLGELHRELALDQPELETWTDWEGAYDPERHYSSAILGGTGVGG
jgi:hypothetical protein